MRRGLLYESSFAFTVEDDEWSKDGDVAKRNINKIGRLFDVSIVGVGAYSDTDVALRSLDRFNIKTEENLEEEEVENLSMINLLTNELTLKSKL